MNAKKLVIIVGPTAVGKTTLSIELAKYFNSPVISADSRQFFREMNIGTAKPTDNELAQVQHHFINNKSINEEYNAGQYEAECILLINQLFAKHDTLIAVGGSGLYINAICEGFDQLPETSIETREYLKTVFGTKGLSGLQELLKKHDPEYYNQIDINNPQRLMRAIEVSIAAGTPYSTLRTNKKQKRDFNIIKIGLNIDRNLLYKKINERVDEMMKKGLIHEAKQLYPLRKLNALQTVGYKEIFEYLEGAITLENAIDKIKQNTRNFAKRQLTWFRKDKSIQWFSPEDYKKTIKLIEDL